MKVVIDDVEWKILDAEDIVEATDKVLEIVKERYGEELMKSVHEDILDAIKALDGYNIVALSIDLRDKYPVPGVAFEYDGKIPLYIFKDLIKRDVSLRLPWYEEDLKKGTLIELYFDI